jgi:hypothetical protein
MISQKVKLNDIRSIHQAMSFFVGYLGEKSVGVLTVTKPSSAAMSLLDFEWDFASFRDQWLRNKFKSAIWTAERQDGTRDWHIHALVEMGWEFKTAFPFEAVRQGHYGAVSAKIRGLWGYLREGAASSGYGRTQLLPIDERGSVRLISYLSGRTLWGKTDGKAPPLGCGSWGRIVEDGRKRSVGRQAEGVAA